MLSVVDETLISDKMYRGIIITQNRYLRVFDTLHSLLSTPGLYKSKISLWARGGLSLQTSSGEDLSRFQQYQQSQWAGGTPAGPRIALPYLPTHLRDRRTHLVPTRAVPATPRLRER